VRTPSLAPARGRSQTPVHHRHQEEDKHALHRPAQLSPAAIFGSKRRGTSIQPRSEVHIRVQRREPPSPSVPPSHRENCRDRWPRGSEDHGLIGRRPLPHRRPRFDPRTRQTGRPDHPAAGRTRALSNPRNSTRVAYAARERLRGLPGDRRIRARAEPLLQKKTGSRAPGGALSRGPDLRFLPCSRRPEGLSASTGGCRITRL
jgi:hypothetical protein